jgi:hypothetical protein
MRTWRNLVIGLAAACVGLPFWSAPSSAAANPVNTEIVAVGVTGVQGPSVLCGGPSYDDWDLTGIAIGPSPDLGTVSLSYDAFGGEYVIDVTLHAASGPTLSGVVYSSNGTNFDGTVESATGSYSNQVGQPLAFNLTVSPETTLGLNEASPIGSSNECSSSSIAPGVAIGSLLVA